MEGAGALLIEKCVNNKFKESKIRAYPWAYKALPCWEEAWPPCPSCSKAKDGEKGCSLLVVLAVHCPRRSSPLPFVV